MSSLRFNLTVLSVSALILRSPWKESVWMENKPTSYLSLQLPCGYAAPQGERCCQCESTTGEVVEGAGGGGDGCERKCMYAIKDIHTYIRTGTELEVPGPE